ncbi:MAG: HSP20 family protein [Candidatus Berkelbacteria bacterium Licking1014_7]|uniref:HSP20 family protein n=1 Tax=Candidatus Berkelbacteria bacterium Licking1014_7 TaxID=2017147 RepID=A0A554LL31_9BACT|nr:MAG: HSP20 family protein [Candidatus Berkelbacteria bacterium Licking1014_7]
MSDIRPLKLKELRQKKALSQQELAEELGVSRQTIFALEKGLWEPSLGLTLRICDMLEVAFEDIFDLEIKNKLISSENVSEERGGKMDRNLMPFSPFRGLGDLHCEIDRFFEDSFSSNTPGNIARMPAINIHEEEDKFIVEAAVPGYREDEIDIEVGDDYLTVKGEKKEEKEEKGKKIHKREFAYGSFERTVSFPGLITYDKVSADLVDGALRISIPKKEPVKPKVRKVKVNKK